MINSRNCGTGENGWTFRYEIAGVILLIIATLLTIVSFSSLGIAAMFVVGGVLCSHRYMSCPVCHSYDVEEDFLIIPEEEEIVKTTKKSTRKKPASKL